MKELLELTAELCALPGISGDEGAVSAYLMERLSGCCDCTLDPLGNLICHKKGRSATGKKILLTAHMDEVGFILTHITEEGMLRFSPVGGVDAKVVAGKTLYVGKDRVPGVVGIKAIHHQTAEERKTPLDYDGLYLDIGAKDKAQAGQVVRLGDTVVFHGPVEPFGSHGLLGKAIDDRAGCAVLARLLLREDLPCDLTAVFTVQEETGCAGAKVAGNALLPDISLVLETTTAADLADVPADQQVCRLGAGPVVSFMDGGTLYDRDLYALALQIAAERRLPLQVKEKVSGGNESRSLQVAGAGSQVLVLSLPTRYLHSPSCVCDRRDLAGMEDMTLALLEALSCS